MRFKSVLGAFLFILLASFLAFIVFIQTKSFGTLVTKIISDVSTKKFATQVQVKSFSLSMFPPGLELNKVNVSKQFSENESFSAELGKIGFYINLIEIEERRLTFGEIRIEDSSIEYLFPKKEEELKEIDQAIINKIFDLSKSAPIRIDTVLIENSRIVVNHELLEAKRLKLFKKSDSFITRFHISNIKPLADKDFSFDEVWGDAEINRSDVHIHRLKAQHDVQTILLKGKIKNYPKLKNSEVSLNGEAEIFLKNLGLDVPMPEMIKLKNGLAHVDFNVNYVQSNVEGGATVHLQEFKSNIFYATDLKTTLSLKSNQVILNSLNLVYKNEKLNLVEPVVVADIKNKTYLTKPIKARAEDVTLNNALRILPSLKVLKGDLNGELTFEYKNHDLYFTPTDGFVVKNLGLVVGTSKKPFTILMVKRATLKRSLFSVIDGQFHMNSSIDLARSKLDVSGYVTKDKVSFQVPMTQINLEDFGNISNLDVKGAGDLAITVAGPLDDTVINLRGKTKGFEILGYKLDQTDKNLSINLADSMVVINKMESQYGKTHISGNGTVNWDNSDIALGISSQDANSDDLNAILTPIFKDLDFLPNDFSYKAKVDVDIFGKTKFEDLKIRSQVNFTDLIAYGETLNSGSFDLSLINKVFAIKGLDAEKGKGSVNGDFSFGLDNKIMNLKYQWENLDLASIHTVKKLGLNLDSKISGNLSGGGHKDNLNLKLRATAFGTRASNYKFEDSNVDLNIYSERIAGKVNLFGEVVKSEFNLAYKPGPASDLKFNVKSRDIKPLAVALFGTHLESEEFQGRIDYEFNTKFQNGFNNLTLFSHLKELTFLHPDVNIRFRSDKPQFIVNDSRIQSWNLKMNEPALYLVTKGEGVFGKDVSLMHEFHFDSKILEVLLAPVMSSEGFIRNIVKVEGKGTHFDVSFSSKAKDLSLSIDSVPLPINHLQYDIEFFKKRLVIQELKTSIDNGSVSVKGDVFFDNKEPDVNLKFVLENAEIPFLGKSSVNLSGEGIILGNSQPYNLSGDINVNRGQVLNELTEFSSKSAGFSQVRYLPKNQESAIGKLLNLNLNVKIENPVRVTNSLMDVAVKGEIRVLGNPSRPRAEGRLYVPVNSSRIFFKNSEYLITNADINFNPKKEMSNPNFDVQATTVISNYKVYPKAYGDLERFNFDLTSDPVLSRNSILSLIAFGYTDELQSALNAKDQQSLSQVGVGSFVFDRFKISDILNKQFGLQINLGTVIEQSASGSLLAGRTQEGQSGVGGGSLGRTRSSTKIELKKRLDEALTLSVSSTMGGSIGQRQSMNLNYGLTKKIQVEGVYEIRTNPEGEADAIDNSVGADLKFRWTFR